MTTRYRIDVEPWGFMRFTLSGFFDHEVFARFVAEREKAFAKLTCAPNAHLTLVDLRRCQLQPQVLAEAFKQLMSESHRRSFRMAFVFGDSPARMQVRRLLTERNDIGLFTDEASAMGWLTDAGARAAA